MLDPTHPLAELIRRDARYRFDAYVFVTEALRYAQEKLGLGVEQPSEQFSPDKPDIELTDVELNIDDDFSLSDGFNIDDEPQRHISGQELCLAMRLYAHEQYGYLAKSVLNHWGIHSTGDFGEIVFNLIEIGQMRKTPSDSREDFEDVFDFDEGFQDSFQISLPDSSEERRS